MIQCRTHYWIATTPEICAGLYISKGLTDPDRNPVALKIFDADGASVSSVIVDFIDGGVGYIDIEQLMIDCKLEGGLRHGHLLVEAPSHLALTCRLQLRDRVEIIGSLQLFDLHQCCLIPVNLNLESDDIIAIVNCTEQDEEVEYSLHFGGAVISRRREIKAQGSRLIHIPTEFHLSRIGQPLQGYLRLSLDSESAVMGAQLIQSLSGSSNNRARKHGDQGMLLYSSIT